MKINERPFITTENDRANELKKAELKNAGSKKDRVSSAETKGDELVLSDRARDISDIALQLKEASEVREEKVSELKARIKDGTYHVSGLDIAEKVFERASNNIF